MLHEIEHNVSLLRDGWDERVEYRVRINGEFEDRANTVRMAGLLAQLKTYADDGDPGPANGAQRGSPNRGGSRPPGAVGGFLLLDEITGEINSWADRLLSETGEDRTLALGSVGEVLAQIVYECQRLEETHPGLVKDVADATRQWVIRARRLLAHDQGQVLFQGSSCGDCGGALAVAREAATATAVRCVGDGFGGGCGMRYERDQWMDLYRAGRTRICETHEAVALLVGADADSRTRLAVKAALFRWRREGLLSGQGTSAKGRALWDPFAVGMALESHIQRHGAPPWENGRGKGVKKS